MSLLRRPLNIWLRMVEKRRLRTGTVAALRKALERQARLFFRGPRGTGYAWADYGGVPCLVVTPRNVQARRYIFYAHGGGFVFGSPQTHSAMLAQLATKLDARIVLPRYRLAPEHPFPAAPQDVRCAWDGLLATGVSAKDVAVGGDSAGGALAFGLIAELLADRAAIPGSVFGLSPLTDLTMSGDSIVTNAQSDVVLPAERGAELTSLYLDGHPAEDAAVSPLFADLDGAPPAWIAVGDTEILLDDARRLAAKIKQGGGAVEIEIEIAHDLPHVWPLFHNVLPEARATLAQLAAWIRRTQHWES